MKVEPVRESDAQGDVKASYDALKYALGSSAVPLFFTYFGAFPEYLSFITSQLTTNISSSEFKNVVRRGVSEFKYVADRAFIKSDLLQDWENRIKITPSYRHFLDDTTELQEINIKIAIIFIALRDSVKGWAVGARKLPSQQGPESIHHTASAHEPESFIYETSTDLEKHESTELTGTQTGIVKSQGSQIEVNLLPKYLSMCRNEFETNMNREQFVYARLAIEKMLISRLDLIPHLIQSPINAVIQLTRKYANFNEFIYLLLDHFPVYSVHRLMYSFFLTSEAVLSDD